MPNIRSQEVTLLGWGGEAGLVEDMRVGGGVVVCHPFALLAK